MLNILLSNDNIIALSYSGEISAEDVDRSYDLINEKLAGDGKISAYFELCDEFDVETAAMLHDLKRAHEIMGKLKQFERVAFVSNVSWIRGIARLEELLFASDNMDVQIYDESEADHALAWVKGEVEDAHDLSLYDLETGDPNVVAFEICGKMRHADIDVARAIMAKFVDDKPPRCAMAKFTRFRGFELSLLADREMIGMKRQTLQNIDRYAMVGAPDWIENIAETLARPLSFELRTFDLDDEDEAMDWMKEKVEAQALTA